jgi:aryl-alcohol dehydrogenase-like predicted oxidoreductase
VRELSVSNVNLEELKEYNKTNKIGYVENRFSFLSRSVDKEFKEYLLKNNISLIPYHLLEIGFLTNLALQDYRLRDGDLREKLPYWNQENQDLIFKFVKEEIAPVAKELGITIEQLNMAWALSQEFIKFVIVGTTRLDYLKTNLKSDEIKLSEEVLERLENIYLDFENKIKQTYNKSVREFRGLNEKYY